MDELHCRLVKIFERIPVKQKLCGNEWMKFAKEMRNHIWNVQGKVCRQHYLRALVKSNAKNDDVGRFVKKVSLSVTDHVTSEGFNSYLGLLPEYPQRFKCVMVDFEKQEWDWHIRRCLI